MNAVKEWMKKYWAWMIGVVVAVILVILIAPRVNLRLAWVGNRTTENTVTPPSPKEDPAPIPVPTSAAYNVGQLSNERAEVADLAMNNIMARGGEDTALELVKLLQSPNKELRKKACWGLIGVGGSAEKILIELWATADDDACHRAMRVIVYIGMGGDSVKEQLRVAMKDNRAPVSYWAQRTMRELCEKETAAVQPLPSPPPPPAPDPVRRSTLRERATAQVNLLRRVIKEGDIVYLGKRKDNGEIQDMLKKSKDLDLAQELKERRVETNRVGRKWAENKGILLAAIQKIEAEGRPIEIRLIED